MKRRARRTLPRYPALVAAATLATLAAGCGPDAQPQRQRQALQGPADAGSAPLPSDFVGGDVAFEPLPDGGAP